MKGIKDNYIGKKFGRLTILNKDGTDKNKHVLVKCKCDCGNIKTILWQNIKSGKTKSCGCFQKEISSINLKKKETHLKQKETLLEKRKLYRKQFIGKKFNRLTIKRFIITKGKGKEKERIECKCDCGNTTITTLWNVLNNHTKSCGCFIAHRLKKGQAGFNIVYNQYKRHSKEKNRIFDLTKKDFKEITQKNCFYCGSEPNTKSKSKSEHSEFIYNGIDRIDPNKGYTNDNIVPCCSICNKMKLDHSSQDFKNYITKIFNFWANKESI